MHVRKITSACLQESLAKIANIWSNHFHDTWHNIRVLLIQVLELNPSRLLYRKRHSHIAHSSSVFYAHKCGMQYITLPQIFITSIEKGEEKTKPAAEQTDGYLHISPVVL